MYVKACPGLVLLVFSAYHSCNGVKHEAVQHVHRKKWPVGGSQEVAASEVPLVLTDSPATAWPALRRWSPAYIEHRVPYLTNVRQQNSSTFIFEDRTRLMAKLRPEWVPPRTTEVNVSTAHLFNAGERGWLYYSRRCNRDLGVVQEDVQPQAFMGLGGEGSVMQNVWFAGPNVSAALHYDPHHNFFVQVFGTKRFLLLSPSAWASVYLYPFYHPHDRHSQLAPEAQEALASEGRCGVPRCGRWCWPQGRCSTCRHTGFIT